MGQGQEIHARKLLGQFMQTVDVLLFCELIESEADGAANGNAANQRCDWLIRRKQQQQRQQTQSCV